MVSTISSGINSYICPENYQQVQRKADCEKPDFVKTMYTTQELTDMMNQIMEENRKEGLKAGIGFTADNWAAHWNKEHPDLVGKRCLYVKGAWRTAEEVQKIEIEENRKWQAENRKRQQNA